LADISISPATLRPVLPPKKIAEDLPFCLVSDR